MHKGLVRAAGPCQEWTDCGLIWNCFRFLCNITKVLNDKPVRPNLWSGSEQKSIKILMNSYNNQLSNYEPFNCLVATHTQKHLSNNTRLTPKAACANWATFSLNLKTFYFMLQTFFVKMWDSVCLFFSLQSLWPVYLSTVVTPVRESHTAVLSAIYHYYALNKINTTVMASCPTLSVH